LEKKLFEVSVVYGKVRREHPNRVTVMTVPSTQDITQLLVAWSTGDQTALERLTPLVHHELHRLAKAYMKRENPGHTLQTMALVHEAYVRLIDSCRVEWQDRAHFFALSARLMRHILVDFARSRQGRRGGAGHVVTFDEARLFAAEREEDLVALDEALNELAKLDARQSQVIELRFFGGLSLKETAEALQISVASVRRDWALARAWLRRQLSRETQA
jgi:RNA polymerase sigma factor (TIGR02999 family)